MISNLYLRDSNPALIVKEITDIEPTVVVDPTLLCTPSILNDESKSIFSKNIDYAVVYGTVFSEHKKKDIHDYCSKNNYKLVSVGYYNNWIKNNHLGLDPTEFYLLMKNCKIVFTSMFHGIMFSVKLKKNFWYSEDPIRENKVRHFINKLGLINRQITNTHDFSKVIDYSKIYEKLDKWITESKNFLIENINRFKND